MAGQRGRALLYKVREITASNYLQAFFIKPPSSARDEYINFDKVNPV